MNCPYKVKVCTECKRILIACEINFTKDKKGKYGLASKCKECNKQYREENKERKKQYYEENKEELAKKKKQYREKNKKHIAEHNKQWRKEHKEEIAKKKKQYYEENKEQIAKKSKQYREENKEQIAEYKKQYYEENKEELAKKKKIYHKNNPHIKFNSHTKRRQIEENQGNGITKEQWLEMMIFFDFKCAYSGEKLSSKKTRTIDHIVALNNGGLNEIWNCVPMYANYNSSKNTKDMEQWYRQQDFFSEDRLNKIYTWIEYAYEKWGKKRRKGNKKNSNII